MTKYYTPTADEIRALRLRLQMTQPELASLFMCSPTTIAKWEQGTNQMPPMVWNAAQIIVAKAEEAETSKQPKQTVYDKKKADKEAEEARKAANRERYEQQLREKNEEYAERRERYLIHFKDIQSRVAKHRPQAMTDFEDKLRTFYEVAQAIGMLENYYYSFGYKDKIDAMNPDLPPYIRFKEAHPDAFISSSTQA